MQFKSPDTTSPCPHCKGKTNTGTRGGCLNCGRVKQTKDGRIKRGLAMLLVASTLLTSACGQLSRSAANWTGYSKVCVEGVTYLQFPSGVAVQQDQSGKVVTCK